MTRHATIIGTGRYLPEIEVPNSVLREQFAHVPDFVDKMEAATGIRRRWYAPPYGKVVKAELRTWALSGCW
jgi:3-oxoacyl-[acyl-carrier-protein] synthase III